MLCLGLCLVLPVGAARAAGFDISPTRVILAPESRAQTLRLHNGSGEPVSFEVTVRRWRMGPKGDWKLEDLSGSTALVVHPLAFTVEAGQTQLIRVGLARSPDAGPEQAYRLFVRELPARSGAKGVPSVGVLTQLSLPVFVSDGQARAQLAIEPGRIEQGRWHYLIRSGDSAHLDPKKFSLRLFDAQGRQLSSQDVMHGYVLAGAVLPVDVKLEPLACAKAERFELLAASPPVSHTGALPPGPRSCAP